MNILKLQIGQIQKEKGINLIKKKGIIKNSIPALAVGIFIIGLSIVLFIFGGMPRYIVNNSKEKELLNKNQELDLLKRNNKEYDSLLVEYLKYGTSYLNDDEKLYFDREIIIQKINTYLIPGGAVMKLRFSDNTLVTTLYSANMSASSKLINLMLNDSDKAIKYASTTSADNDLVIKNGQENTITRIPTVEMKIVFSDGDDYGK